MHLHIRLLDGWVGYLRDDPRRPPSLPTHRARVADLAGEVLDVAARIQDTCRKLSSRSGSCCTKPCSSLTLSDTATLRACSATVHPVQPHLGVFVSNVAANLLSSELAS